MSKGDIWYLALVLGTAFTGIPAMFFIWRLILASVADPINEQYQQRVFVTGTILIVIMFILEFFLGYMAIANAFNPLPGLPASILAGVVLGIILMSLIRFVSVRYLRKKQE
jgi:hypothetical protein